MKGNTSSKGDQSGGDKHGAITSKGDSKGWMRWLRLKWCATVNHITTSFLGGPRFIKLSHVINFQKCSTLAVCILMMRRSGNRSETAIVYSILHGGYGLCWLLKETVFPDAKWQQKITIGSAAMIFLTVLGPYWLIAYNAIMRDVSRSGNNSLGGSSERSCVTLISAGAMCLVGLTLMIGADAQKFFVLKKVKGLMTDGFFSICRHPNYLGEMMIYGSFAAVSGRVSSWVICGCIWGGVFVPFMLEKEDRMSRHPEWTAYQARTPFLFPRPFRAFRRRRGAF